MRNREPRSNPRPGGAALRVAVSWHLRRPWRASALLERVARHVARVEGFLRGELSIAVVDAAAMAALHKEHLGIAGPTDVLTFDLGTDWPAGILEGEIVVCADVARQSAAAQASHAELALYVTHGLLHLAGYDDRTPAASRRIHAREDALLTALGLGAVFSQAGDACRGARRRTIPRRRR